MVKSASSSNLPVNFTICFSIYLSSHNKIMFSLNGKSLANMFAIGIEIELTNGDLKETLIFKALDELINKEVVLSTAAELPKWRSICTAIKKKANHFVVAVDNQLKMDFVMQAELEKEGRKFPDKVSELIPGPNIGFTGMITYVNIHDNLKKPENIECGAPGGILEWNFLDWNITQLQINPPVPVFKNVPDQVSAFQNLTPEFTICFKVFIIGGNYIEINIHQGRESGVVGYQTRNNEYVHWEEKIYLSRQEKMVSKVLFDFFPQWRYICIRVDTILGLVNVSIEDNLVLNNYVVKALVNTTDKLPENSFSVLQSLKWKYPSQVETLNAYSKFYNNYRRVRGDLYKWDIRHWSLDKTLKTMIRNKLVKKEEICGKNVFLKNDHKKPLKSAARTCQMIGKLSSSIRDLARTIKFDASTLKIVYYSRYVLTTNDLI